MNTIPKHSGKNSNALSGVLKKAAARPAAAAIVLGAVVLVAGAWLFSSGEAETSSTLLGAVARGPLVISVTESGTIKSREQVIIKAEVEGRTTVLSLVPEGTHVKPGDLLAELDASSLEEQRVSQQITVLNAEASFIRARENLEVVKSQAVSDVERAKLDYSFAQTDLTKYEEGDYRKELQKVEANIFLATEELKRATTEKAWSEELYKDKYITETELSADVLAMQRADLNVKQAETDLKLLKEYTYPRQMEQLKSNVDQTKMSLDRTERTAAGNVVQAEADFKAKQQEFDRQKARLEKTIDQIGKCRIKAPVAGMVVYATTGRGGFRGNEQPLAEGQEVRERQELIYLPTATAMTAEVKVQESSLRKVAVGMPVKVTVDAVPGRVMQGTVTKIGLLPDAQSMWLNPDLKVYNTEINLNGEVTELRPGMSCRAEIIVQRLEDALYVPVQAVTRVSGKPTVYVMTSGGSEPRTVETGLDNNRWIHITAGLAEGEKILLAPPLEPASLSPGGEEGEDAYAGFPETIEPPAAPETAVPAEGAPDTGAGEIDFSQLRDKTPEERAEFFNNLTPEQREAMAQRFRGGPGGRTRSGEGTGQEGTASEGSGERGSFRRGRGEGGTGEGRGTRPEGGSSSRGGGADEGGSSSERASDQDSAADSGAAAPGQGGQND